MPLKKDPVFRRAIVPWYDSEIICFLVLFFLLAVVCYSFAGVAVAMEARQHHQHLWVPILLLMLSGSVTVSIIARLIKRYLTRLSK